MLETCLLSAFFSIFFHFFLNGLFFSIFRNICKTIQFSISSFEMFDDDGKLILQLGTSKTD